MDKNTITGFVLIGLLLFAFSWFNQPSAEHIEAQRRYQDSLYQIEVSAQQAVEANRVANSLSAIVESVDSTKMAQLQQTYGGFAEAMTGVNESVTLENDVLELRFNTKGGSLVYARLKDYATHDSLPLVLFDETQTSLSFDLVTVTNRVISTGDLFFTPVDFTSNSLTMRLNAGEGSYLDFVYALAPNDYRVQFTIKSNGLNGVLAPNTTALDFTWRQSARQLEKGRKYEDQYTTIYYKLLSGKVDYLSETGNDSKKLTERARWIANKNKFFSTILIADNGFESANMESVMTTETNVLKNFKSMASVSFDLRGSEPTTMQYFIGPNRYNLLNSYNHGVASADQLNLERIVPLGISVLRWINKYFVIPIFDFLGGIFNSYGLIIFLLTLIVKLILLPLTYKSYISSAKMRVLRPQVEVINAKYPGQDQAMERQRETMELYSKAGASPLSGCIPMLLQMPILIALFMFFPSAIELRQESFLWASDLSSYDAIVSWDMHIPVVSTYFGNHISLFCLLMAATNVVYTKFNMDATNTGQQQMPGMKAMMYMMPLMMLVFFNQYASGLVYYYFISTLITVLQTLSFRYTINEEKLLAKLEENKKKPRKKSGFMKRLEEAQRIAQEEQARKQKGNK